MVVCLLLRSVGIGSAEIFSNELNHNKKYIRVIVFIRVLLGAHEEHVFQVVGQALRLKRILQRPHPYTQGRTRLLSLLIRDDETFDLVLQPNSPVQTLVTLTLNHIPQYFHSN